MILLSALLFVLRGDVARCRDEGGGFAFNGDLRQFAVGPNWVYIATQEKLYQLTHDLTLVRSLTQRGILQTGKQGDLNSFHRVLETDEWNATFSINLLLPLVENRTLISCGLTHEECGQCEVLDLKNISNVQHSEIIPVGPQRGSNTSVAFLVNVKTRVGENDTYILTGIGRQGSSAFTGCFGGPDAINLHNTKQSQLGGIFSYTMTLSAGGIKRKDKVEFVDGFQVGSFIYLFSNLPSANKRNKIRLIWFEGKNSKVETFGSLRGATLVVSDEGEGSRLIASSVVPGGPPLLWSGVFSVDGGNTNTELVLFNISCENSRVTNTDPDFCSSNCGTQTKLEPTTLKPMKVLLKKIYMTSVLAVRQKAWMVFFIGTGDGQLIKLAVDKNYRTTCPWVLYRANGDRQVFPKLQLDQSDRKYLYVPFQNEVKRIPVSECSAFTKVLDCWSARDPFCVWCSSRKSCTFVDDCKDLDWLSIPEEFQKKMISYKVVKDSSDQVVINVQAHVVMGAQSIFSCNVPQFCRMDGLPPQFPKCSCILTNSTIPAEGLHFQIRFRFGSTQLRDEMKIYNCADIKGLPTNLLYWKCINAGCGWSKNGCSWAIEGEENDSVFNGMHPGMNFSRPEITSISPSTVSFYGWNHAVLSGRNLGDVTRVRFQDMGCSRQESVVWRNTGLSLTFRIPSTENKGVVEVCVLLPDESCHGNATITYRSLPSCTNITPNSSWISGNRTIRLTGSHLEFVEGVLHSHKMQEVRPPRTVNYQNLTYNTPATENSGNFQSDVFMRVGNENLACSGTVTYYPDPEFITYTTTRTGDDVRITIQKKADRLGMTLEDLSVWGLLEGKEYPCIMNDKETSVETDYFICDIQETRDAKFQQLKINYGEKTVILTMKTSAALLLIILLVLLLIPCIIGLVVIIYRRKQKKLAAEMKKIMDDLELDIRNDIRQGFVDLQTEKAELMDNVGAIPFLDYKHFASRIFFPESESLMKLCIKDIDQEAVQNELDGCCQSLSMLIQDEFFLTSMLHALEEQKSFTIKDKCLLASLLTVSLHSNLSYLTEVMQALLRDLMQKNTNTQPKLLLRRTESVVEKLLTNWISICLYGFLRESVGQHLFLMVSALIQQTAKGPVDCVMEKALYTLSEDWLLWQAPDFSSVKLNVQFAVGGDGEVSEPLEVNALSCDSVEQVKEKILSTFKAKFGFPYNIPLRDLLVEYEKNGSLVLLEEVDASSGVIGEVTMLNTLRHYMVTDGTTIKVFSRRAHPPVSPQGSLKDDKDFSGKYFHLIDPEVEADPRKNPERKKFKLKEVHLTKLLSTKVAVHSFVENLFRSIWATQCRAPRAVKYLFDFLDSQAENMKMTDPDVLHIWKTNSLPLRFWVNIIKNPQFVFDIEKTPNLDGCLSVIAQAFMDSFSLSELQLGKHAPTNKLLYAKDIPKFKQEVKVYYKQVRDQPTISSSEFKNFLKEESKKHENGFNEAAALIELYKFIKRYFTEIREKLEQSGAPTELMEQLHHVRNRFEGLKSCSWN